MKRNWGYNGYSVVLYPVTFAVNNVKMIPSLSKVWHMIWISRPLKLKKKHFLIRWEHQSQHIQIKKLIIPLLAVVRWAWSLHDLFSRSRAICWDVLQNNKHLIFKYSDAQKMADYSWTLPYQILGYKSSKHTGM